MSTAIAAGAFYLSCGAAMIVALGIWCGVRAYRGWQSLRSGEDDGERGWTIFFSVAALLCFGNALQIAGQIWTMI